MKSIQRLLSGALAGGVLVFAAAAVAPRGLQAQDDGYCYESGGGKITCCSKDPNGKVLDCVVLAAQ